MGFLQLWRAGATLFINFIYLFIYFWLCWVFVSVQGLSLVAASGGHSSSQCAGLSLSRPLLLRSTSSRRTGSVVVAHGPSCSVPCGIFPDQGSNPCPLQRQSDSQPLRHQGSPLHAFWAKALSAVLSNILSRMLVNKGPWKIKIVSLSRAVSRFLSLEDKNNVSLQDKSWAID